MKLKKKVNTKNSSIRFRCTEEEYNEIKRKALLYCEGNLSEWVLYTALNYVPNKSELEKPQKKNKKGS